MMFIYLYIEKKIQKKKSRRIYMVLPTLEEAQKKWNVMQEFEYKYDNEDEDELVWDSDDSDSD